MRVREDTMAGRCGATPGALEVVGRSAGDREDRLLRAASTVASAADDLRAIGSPSAAAVGALAGSVRARARAGAELDRWVGQVGLRLAAAGEGSSDANDAVAFGDLDHARHVAVLVPGMGATLA